MSRVWALSRTTNMGFSVELAPAGIVLTHWDTQAGTNSKEVCRPKAVAELLRFWHYALEGITPNYTLADFFSLVDLRDIDVLAGLLTCDVGALVVEARVASQATAAPARSYLLVSNSSWAHADSQPLGNAQGRHTLSCDVSAYGPDLTSRGKVTPSGIGMCPISDILHFPLRYDPTLIFHAPDSEEPLFTTSMTITFGQFVHALFWELGYWRAQPNLSWHPDLIYASEPEAYSQRADACVADLFDIEVEREKIEAFTPPTPLDNALRAMDKHGANLCQTPGVLGLIIEGVQDAHLVVLVCDIDDMVNIPLTVDGVPVTCRHVDDWQFGP